ncbi:MAG: hypothetical protein WCY41_00895 [Candidatus Micrarchaeia archaeon]
MADYTLSSRSGAVAKKSFDVVITRFTHDEKNGKRKFEYTAFFANVGERVRTFGAKPDKEIRIRITDEVKPIGAQSHLDAPQRFCMLRFRTDSGAASVIAIVINMNEDHHGATPHYISQALLQAVCYDLKSEGVELMDLGVMRANKSQNLPFEKLMPLVSAKLAAEGYAFESTPASE